MRFPTLGVLVALLAMRAWGQAPLTYAEIQAKARPSLDQLRADVQLAENSMQLNEARGFLREGPTVAFSAGPRRTPGAPTTTDRSFEVDVPLFLSPGRRADLESALGAAHPLLREAARREGALRLRAAYLEAWLAARVVALREADTATVARWGKAAQARFEAGADAGFQVSLVEGEGLKARQELQEARQRQAQAWAALVALADLPPTPAPLADPEPPAALPVEAPLEQSPLHRALQAQAELEERSLRLKEAQQASRWSLRGGHAQEGDERVTRLGLAVRLPRPGENSALRRSTEAQLQALRGGARVALAELEARYRTALARLKDASNEERLPDFGRALQAVELRLQEGKERPSEALPIRRQLLEAQEAHLRRLHSRQLLSVELECLLPEVKP